MKRILITILSILLLSACSITDEFNDEYVYVTMYPIEYATKELYSDYASISSVYPNDSTSSYEVTSKKEEKYAKGEIFIYSGINKEAYLAKDLINLNNNLKIIDATKGMSDSKTHPDIAWIDPSNYLMLCSNIKTLLIEYSDNPYIKESIEENYKILNEKISELDVKLYDIGKNGNYSKILVTSDMFNYLSKYNIDVISIDDDNQTIDKSYAEAKKLISSKDIQYIYSLDNEKLSETQEKFISDNSIVKVQVNNLFTLSDKERESEEDYITLMESIIELYKKELYKN